MISCAGSVASSARKPAAWRQTVYTFGDRKEFKERSVRSGSLPGLGKPLTSQFVTAGIRGDSENWQRTSRRLIWRNR